MSMTVHAPEGWSVVANGFQSGEPTAGPTAPDGSPRRTWRWYTGTPVSAYNFVFGAAEMVTLPLVITSYSIHYTKLYDGMGDHGRRPAGVMTCARRSDQVHSPQE